MFLLLMEAFKFSLQTLYSSASSPETEFGEISNTTSNLFPDRIPSVAFPVFVRFLPARALITRKGSFQLLHNEEPDALCAE